MRIFEHITFISKEISNLKSKSKRIGFVPTMGALHKGHLSLIETSLNQNDITIVSIFVNPTQFDDENDLKKYPKTLNEDIGKLKKLNCDIVFIPSVKEMYPKPDNKIFDFKNLDKIMEGKQREGHFNGVALIVSKLFDIIKPDKAYFGEKDFQQLVIIKDLVKQLGLLVEIVPCPIIREEDGLAYSSRNKRLSTEERKNVAIISQVLFKTRDIAQQKNVDQTKKWVIQQINANSFLEVEYFEIVDDEKMEPIKQWDEKKNKIGCIAVKVGKVRLIDNIKFYS